VEVDRRHLESLLRTLDEEERALSAQRAKLHDRLGFYPDDTALVERERDVSLRRRELHARIDAIRAQLDLEPWRPGGRQAEPTRTTSAGFDVDLSGF
jgi:hypothetical protein